MDGESRLPALRVFMQCVLIAFILVAPIHTTSEALSQNRRIYVPADRVNEWPKGDWVPVKAKTLSQYVGSLPSESGTRPEPKIDSAIYTARFMNGNLEKGSFSAKLSLSTIDAEKRIDFDTAGLTWTLLQAPRGKAVFGSTASGRLIAQIEAGTSIQGQWKSVGKKFFDETEFHLKLLPARNSVMEITLPKNLSLEVSGASLYYKTRSVGNHSHVWKIQLGNRRDCTLRVISVRGPQYPPIVVQERHNWFVQKPTVRLAVEYDFRILDRRNKLTLNLACPSLLQIEQINLNGQQVESYSFEKGRTTSKLGIDIPVQSRGAKYRLLVVARCPLLMGRQWKVPLIRLSEHRSESSIHSFRFEDSCQAAIFFESRVSAGRNSR